MNSAVEEIALRPDAQVADLELALHWADDVLKRFEDSRDNEAGVLNTMGYLLYRLRRLDRAKAALERALELREQSTAFDDVFLAMVAHQMGEPERARITLAGRKPAFISPEMRPVFADFSTRRRL